MLLFAYSEVVLVCKCGLGKFALTGVTCSGWTVKDMYDWLAMFSWGFFCFFLLVIIIFLPAFSLLVLFNYSMNLLPSFSYSVYSVGFFFPSSVCCLFSFLPLFPVHSPTYFHESLPLPVISGYLLCVCVCVCSTIFTATSTPQR